MRKPLAIVPVSLLACLAALLIAGCGGGGDSSSTAAETGGSTGAESGSTAGEGTSQDAACEPGTLETKSPETLTIATDEPAYPPYFEDEDPTNGEGFESAVAYAIAEQLGYSKGQVEWTVEPFNASYAPGEKDFDFDVNQITITPAREKAVDFSAPYYRANQAVVALDGSDAAKAKSLADLKDTKIGVQINTTSLSTVEDEIDPSSQPEVFDSSGDVVTALKNGQVEAVVVDLPTALYLTAVQVENATIVGQFGGAEGEAWGALLTKDSPLTSCVSEAVEALEGSGELAQITKRWLSQAAGAPELG